MTPERSLDGPVDTEVHAASIVHKSLQQEVIVGGGTISLTNFANTVDTAAEQAPEEVQRLLAQYLAGFQTTTHNAVVNALPEGVGGQFDGNTVFIAASTMEVGPEGVATTVEQIGETLRHEAYHKLNAHTAALTVGGSAKGDIAVTIGEIGFTRTELIEGLTVLDTGNVFVSDEYREFEANLKKGVAQSDVSMDDVRRAVNEEKDLRRIDNSAKRVLAL